MVTTTGTRLPRLNARRTSWGTTMPTLLPPVGSRTVRKVVMATFLLDPGELWSQRAPALSVSPAVRDDDIARRGGDLVDQGQAGGVAPRLEEPPTSLRQ